MIINKNSWLLIQKRKCLVGCNQSVNVSINHYKEFANIQLDV